MAEGIYTIYTWVLADVDPDWVEMIKDAQKFQITISEDSQES